MGQILIEKWELESLLLKVVNFISKKETVETYTFRNLPNNLICEIDKFNCNVTLHNEGENQRVNINYLLKNLNKKYLINYNNLKNFIYSNITDKKFLKTIIETIDYVYIDILPDNEFEEIFTGNDFMNLLFNLRINNIDFIENFEVILIK